MLYLLDANVLIDANRDYYPLARVPQFWEWIAAHARLGNLAMPVENYDEVVAGNEDELAVWLRRTDIKDVLVMRAESDAVLVSRVVAEGYAPDLTDTELEAIGNDPFLIAHALADYPNRCVVTTERSRPSRTRHNRHVPDVCRTFGIDCCNTFELTRRLDFRAGSA